MCVCLGGGIWTTSRRTATFFRETFPKTFNINTISFSSISPVARPMDRNKSHKKLLVLLYSNPCQKVSQIHLRRRTFLPTAPPSGPVVMVTNHKKGCPTKTSPSTIHISGMSWACLGNIFREQSAQCSRCQLGCFGSQNFS